MKAIMSQTKKETKETNAIKKIRLAIKYLVIFQFDQERHSLAKLTRSRRVLEFRYFRVQSKEIIAHLFC